MTRSVLSVLSFSLLSLAGCAALPAAEEQRALGTEVVDGRAESGHPAVGYLAGGLLAVLVAAGAVVGLTFGRTWLSAPRS